MGKIVNLKGKILVDTTCTKAKVHVTSHVLLTRQHHIPPYDALMKRLLLWNTSR